MNPLFFFPKIYDPQYIWDPPSEENASPLFDTGGGGQTGDEENILMENVPCDAAIAD